MSQTNREIDGRKITANSAAELLNLIQKESLDNDILGHIAFEIIIRQDNFKELVDNPSQARLMLKNELFTLLSNREDYSEAMIQNFLEQYFEESPVDELAAS